MDQLKVGVEFNLKASLTPKIGVSSSALDSYQIVTKGWVRRKQQKQARTHHISHEEGTYRIGNFTEPSVVQLPRVGGGARDNKTWPEVFRSLLQCIVVDQPRLFVHVVGHWLEEEARSRSLQKGKHIWVTGFQNMMSFGTFYLYVCCESEINIINSFSLLLTYFSWTTDDCDKLKHCGNKKLREKTYWSRKKIKIISVVETRDRKDFKIEQSSDQGAPCGAFNRAIHYSVVRNTV